PAQWRRKRFSTPPSLTRRHLRKTYVPPWVPGQNEVKEPFHLAGFRTAYVFDVAQTEGRPLPEFAKTTGDPKDYVGKLRTLVEKQGIGVEYDPTIAPAQGVSTGGRIRLMPDLPPA